MCSKAHTPPTAPFVLHCTRIDKCAMKKFRINGQLLNKLFYRHPSFFTIKSRRECSTHIYIAQFPQFLIFFQLPKAEQRPLRSAHLSIAEG
jgi:hypothetical protein